MSVTDKARAYDLFKTGASRTEISEATGVKIHTADKWILEFEYLEASISKPQKNILYISRVENELFNYLEKEGLGTASPSDKKRSKSLQTIYVSFNAFNSETK